MAKKTKKYDKREAFEDIKKLYGYPPYNNTGNFLFNDSAFAELIGVKYGVSSESLHKKFNFEERLKSSRIVAALLKSKFDFDDVSWKMMK